MNKSYFKVLWIPEIKQNFKNENFSCLFEKRHLFTFCGASNINLSSENLYFSVCINRTVSNVCSLHNKSWKMIFCLVNWGIFKISAIGLVENQYELVFLFIIITWKCTVTLIAFNDRLLSHFKRALDLHVSMACLEFFFFWFFLFVFCFSTFVSELWWDLMDT